MHGRWSKWWWLQFHLTPRWSADERLAATAFCATFLTAFLFQVAIFGFYISRLKLGLIITLIAAIVISLLSTISSVRGLGSALFPGTIKKGDEAAAKRAGGAVSLPEKSPGLWWINYGAGNSRLSREERFVTLVIFLIAMLIFVPAALYFPPHLMIWFDVSKRTSILTIMVTMLPLSYVISRRLSAAFWPDVTRAADGNAWARFNRRTP